MIESLIGTVPVTAIYAGILGLMAILLANFVLYVRVRGKRAPEWQGDASFRAQANFVENVPLALVLLLVLELQGMAPAMLHLCGVLLVLFRAMHAWGLGTFEDTNYPRMLGAQGTFVLISVMAVAAIASAVVA